MSLDQTLFACWAQEKTGGIGSGGRVVLVSMEEGVKGSERSRDDTVTALLQTGYSTGYVEYTLPIPVGTVIPAGSVFFVSARAKRNAAADAGLDIKLIIDGTTTITGDKIGPFGADAATATGTVTVSSEAQVESYVVLRLVRSTATLNGDAVVYYLHDDCHFGADSTDAAGCVARSAFLATALSPATGTHASPTPIDAADISLELAGCYADDVIELGKWTDAAKTAAHSASAESVQSVGGVDTETDSFPALSTRRVAFSADATRKPDTLTNTYYVVEVLCGAASVGTLAFETRLAAEQPTLTSLAGTSTTPVITTSAHPVVSWTHTNTAATHYQVRVYDAADDSLDHDSTELTGAAMQGSYVIDGADLAGDKHYYVIVTSMNGSSGSTWSIDSARGYFDLAWASSAVKITSHEGSSDTPAVITSRAPTIEWAFSRTQAAYNIAVVDTADESIEYESGWVTSATKSQALPANELDLGHTYSVQVQVKDTQGNVYAADKRAWVHVNESSIDAPALTAEADATTADSVTLAWTAPVANDSDALTYEVEITQTLSGTATVTTYSVGTATSLVVGHLDAAAYSWRVRATDAHALAGTWAAPDAFDVTDAGTAPTVTLIPLATSTLTTPRSCWITTDVDGDAQTHYEVEIDNNADFGSIAQDSGEVASTAMYHVHTALAAGTWYRRVRAKAGGTWSSFVDDSFVIVAATSQTDEWELYLDAEGTPTALDLATYPVSGLTVGRRLDGPTEFSFAVNNFDGLEGGIDDDEEILLYLKDTDGKRLEFRGQVQTKGNGLMCEVRCADIAAKFARWQVSIERDHATLATVIAAMIENPTGNAATGIVCHVEECEDPETAGKAITMLDWRGQNKTVAAWLSEFQTTTGFRWYCECIAGTWHFHWFNPATSPAWAVTLKDSIEYSAESASQWRVLDGAKLDKSMAEYANRIRYNAYYEPPALPPGVAHWDDVWTEADDLWAAYTGVTVAEDAADYQVGTKSICFTYSITGAAGGTAIPRSIDLGYFLMPALYRDWNNNYFDALRADLKFSITMPTLAGTWIGGEWIYANPAIQLLAFSGADVGPSTTTETGKLLGASAVADHWQHWGYYIYDAVNNSAAGYSDWSPSNINAVALRWCWPQNGQFPDCILAEGETLDIKLWVDDLRILNSRPKEAANIGSFYVETAAVTAGTEVPMEAELSNTGLTQSEARALALTWLDIKGRAKATLSGVSVAGIRNVPMKVMIPVALTGGPVVSTSYPLAEVTWRAADAGWSTELTLGDMPADLVRTMQKLSRSVGNLSAEILS